MGSDTGAFFASRRRRHTRWSGDWGLGVCSAERRLTYLSMWITPVSRSTSTPQKSKTKPYTAELLISSAVFGASSTEGLQNTVSHNAVGSGAGRLPGDQWLAAATLAKRRGLSGVRVAA